ncbi:MAG: hypothetical protein ACKOBD_17810, partial [Chloroflexota bacterium]
EPDELPLLHPASVSKARRYYQVMEEKSSNNTNIHSSVYKGKYFPQQIHKNKQTDLTVLL